MQIIYTLRKVTKRRIENLVFLLVAGTSSLLLILFFCSFAKRLGDNKIGLADFISLLLSFGLIWSVISIFIKMFKKVRYGNNVSFLKILSPLFGGGFCLFSLIYGELIAFHSDVFLSFVSEWLPYISCYTLLGIVIVAYQTLRDWHLGQYMDYIIELYNKECLYGLPHFYLSNDLDRVPLINEMKKNLGETFVSQKDIRQKIIYKTNNT
jgi:hypothetical protein